MERRLVLGWVALAIAGGGLIWKRSLGSTDAQPVADVLGQPSDVDMSSIVEMAMGPEDAKVTIIEYASFTCPHCARFHQGPLKQMKADYIDKGLVHFIYRDVYFDRFGLMAAQIARCGGRERFFDIADLLYSQQREWIAGGDDPAKIAANLRRIGKVAGLGEDTLEVCLADKAQAETLVAWYNQNAQADNVRSTPSFIINGEPYSNMSYGDFKKVIDAKLAE
ncbi:Periplasmic thiol:disulfide interchange protein DsbA [hydrothermal vent metagenome]|uniref:Periplasmic thiol:disulfide interchange protein DsbA n=1 Tax=hydrothermal vent metagenome TaxID=652676 RepID=A0A3B0SA67_9ZZZZ